MSGKRATAEAIVAATPAEAYAISGPVDPPTFYPRSGPLPGVVAVRDQSGPWDTVGRTRRLELSDGGHVSETITDADSPGLFAYELSDFQKLFGSLVTGARAEWRFEPVATATATATATGAAKATATATATAITWTYTFFAKPGRGWIVAIIVRTLWGPYMRRVLPPIAREVERLAQG